MTMSLTKECTLNEFFTQAWSGISHSISHSVISSDLQSIRESYMVENILSH